MTVVMMRQMSSENSIEKSEKKNDHENRGQLVYSGLVYELVLQCVVLLNTAEVFLRLTPTFFLCCSVGDVGLNSH